MRMRIMNECDEWWRVEVMTQREALWASWGGGKPHRILVKWLVKETPFVINCTTPHLPSPCIYNRP
jgi:hypothetical protein